MSVFGRKKKQRQSLYQAQVYDAEAAKTPQPFVYEHDDVGWTTSDYDIPKDFAQFYHIDFVKQASSMVGAVDEGVPNYMDQRIYDASAEALAFLLHKHSAHTESINEIIARKKVTLACIERELTEIEKEEERLGELVKEIGGHDYA